MKKAVLTLLIVLLLLVGAVWYFVAFRLDSTIEKAIEESGSQALGTSVQVGGLETNIKDGSLKISQLTVANLPGYDAEHAISFSGIEAAVDYDGFVISRIIIESPEVNVEEKGGKSNFGDMLAGMESGKSSEAAESEAEPTTIEIRYFRMDKSRAAYKSELLDKDSELKIGAVELNNIKGTPDEVASVIANEIIGKISAAVAVEIVKDQARKKLGLENKDDDKESVGDKLKGIFGGDDDDSGN